MQGEQKHLNWKPTMKAKTQFAATILILITSLNAVFAQLGGGGGMTYPTPGGANPYPAAPAIDPRTGLPIAQSTTDWKDPNWKDPDKVLRQVDYDGLLLLDVVANLRQEFTNDFDVLVGAGWSDPSGVSVDPQGYAIKLKLKNVSASEIFNAMNLEFEAENCPLRWRLLMNGKRPMAILRVVPELVPPATGPRFGFDPTTGLPIGATPPPAPRKSRVFFVGDLIGNGMNMDQIVETVTDLWKMNYPNETGAMDGVRFHKGAQVLVVNGDDDHIEFMIQILGALKEKASMTKGGAKSVDSKTKADEPKSGGAK
jgi:hypothetical protein